MMTATPSIFLAEIFSFRIRAPRTKTQTKLVEVMQGMTERGTYRRAT